MTDSSSPGVVEHVHDCACGARWDEDEQAVRADERRRVAALLDENAGTITGYTSDDSATLKLIAWLASPDDTGATRVRVHPSRGRVMVADMTVCEHGGLRRKCDTCDLHDDLLNIAKHWPGVYTRHCLECEVSWPCEPILETVRPYLDELEALERTVCPHESADGVDQVPVDSPTKVWRCNACGQTFTDPPVESGATRAEGT